MKKHFNRSFICYIFLFLAFGLFFFHISNISRTYYDEFHYIPAAKQWLLMNPTTNVEHPPLGKYLIAIGIKVFGDNPVGWRAATITFGSISILAIFLISEILFSDLLISSFIGLMSLLNFWIYIQARIAMLDTFMVTFLLLAFYYFLKYKFEEKRHLNFYLSSFFGGLAVAVKWSAIFIYLPFLVILIFNNQTKKNLIDLLLFVLFSINIYFMTFFPYMFVSGNYKMTFAQIYLETPLRMLKLQESVPAKHPYLSSWHTWPLMIRPIWYEFLREPDSPVFRGVILLGNPIQMLMGIVSVLGLTFNFKKINEIARSSLIIFLVSWLFWAIAPRKLSFFYYYFPSAIFYSVLIPMFLKEILSDKNFKISLAVITLLSLLFFLYFFPIISGEEALEATRTKWQWLNSWN